MTTQQTAEAFSRHRFAEAFPHLHPDVRWTAHGQGTTQGRDAVVAACERTATELAGTTTEFTRFVSVAGPDVAAVDVVARYTDADGGVAVVASCDVYEFSDGLVTAITSYAVELPAG